MHQLQIKHVVIFCLHTGKGTPETDCFLKESADELSRIPGVEHFEVLQQVSFNNNYDYGFSMVFANQAAYDAYQVHPLLTRYVAEYWVNQVSRFQEMDFIDFNGGSHHDTFEITER
ncbi:Dabb family protein [Paenibacillus sp. SYP-B3998]|uniref:Dabb family protein n=1 Tax=Paenibacillus sp. SYP-B3998 TaxID=2678564 RepID=A0A6G3ZYF7_9BACL|nr:Dabb family protein [Paenibacillus sp. SYP-B3998]NEW06611.1 Dabb family protein [Paenibacillus sp. SYP-B3998]